MRSPLEDVRKPWPWWPLVLATVFSSVAFGLAVSLGGSGEPAAPSSTTVATVVAPDPGVVVEETPFPSGYTAIGDDVSVRAEAPVTGSDGFLVPFTVAVRRGTEPGEVPQPLGGRWVMETPGGVLESVTTHHDRLRPGVFSVEFTGSAVAPGELRLAEVWEPTPFEATHSFDWDDVPFTLEEPLRFEVADGVVFHVDSIELSVFLGELAWRFEGADLAVAEVTLELLRPDGELLGRYATAAPGRDPTRLEDRLNYFWPFFNRVSTREATTLVVTVRGELGTRVAADVVVPLPSG